MNGYRPPFTITPEILKLATDISEVLGQLKSYRFKKPNPLLRKKNSIRTIQGSLGIEGNSFTLEQITTLLDGKRVLGKPKEILEVKNAIQAYSKISKYNPWSLKSLLEAHRDLMNGLVQKPGKFRTGAVGIMRGSKVAHVAPKAAQVQLLMEQLFEYLKNPSELGLIKSCVFHYEFEFIHPFEDGNGRVGRLWQTSILSEYNGLFEYVPIESQILANQNGYYKALEVSDKSGNSTFFIEWMLKIILESLREFFLVCAPGVDTPESRLESAREAFGKNSFSRQDYIRVVKRISAPTASRDLATAVQRKVLGKVGDKRTTRYSFNK